MSKPLVFFTCLAFFVVAPMRTTAQIEKLSDGALVAHDGGWIRLTVESDRIVRVMAAKDRAFFSRASLMLAPRAGAAPTWQLTTSADTATLATARLEARVDLRTGAVTFLDATGATILAERADGRTIAPAEVQGEKTFHVRQQWTAPADESLYGLGQQQLGIIDLKGYDLDLWQRNTHVVVPFLVSSRGYGILWDNNSLTRFGDLREFEPIPAESLRDTAGHFGGLTEGTFTAASPDELTAPHLSSELSLPRRGRGAGAPRGPRPGERWVGELVPTMTGEHQLQTYSNGGIKVWLDGKLIIDHWRQNWLTEYDQVKVHLEAGHRYPIKIESGGDQTTTMELRWKTPAPTDTTSLWSEVGDGIDYHFVYGPALDDVVAGYRVLTGRATLMPRWALGLWQSRQRYEKAQESLDVVNEYRQRGLPFDNIVQDWQYWPRDAWGSHAFDPERFPDPDAWIKAIHAQHAHVMISVWGKFYPGTANFDAMQKGGYLYQPDLVEGAKDWIGFPFTFYDAFNREGGKLFWQQIDAALFRRGIDAWWMDATEPDLISSPPTLERMRSHMHPTALGTASRVLNASSLENSRNVYEGQRASAPDQRVFILTRSGFAGIQRFATATWSGDVTSTWTALAKQIPAGLGFSLSGVPWWTTDSGGYTMQAKFSAKTPTPEALDEWRELNARWFQFATFCPLTRLHGELQPREPWTFGGDDHPAYRAIAKFDRLRYRLLPYLYSIAAAATHDDGTMMRPLVMDFPADAKARTLTDEYLFGPAFLVAPVTQYQARSRAVYLPDTRGGWFDFWTGAQLAGGKQIDAPAPYDALPLHVRAGAIVPFGPDVQWTDEKPADPITLHIYAGADGAFTLYEDDGKTYGYERGEFARIPLRWDDATRTLTIGARTGTFPGMLAERTFEVVLVSAAKPVGFSFASKPDRTVRYRGERLTLTFP
ncbi:MAG TPA: TIM-barrel domain-containing protein [Opitutaceae bacterium]|nr:TIM-barrel domain-containing protein [Opitutaceae bacterium]